MIKDLTGYEGNLPSNKYWKKEFHGMPFTVSFDNRKGDDCIGSGSIGILFADGEEIVVSNVREELVKYELSHTLVKGELRKDYAKGSEFDERYYEW